MIRSIFALSNHVQKLDPAWDLLSFKNMLAKMRKMTIPEINTMLENSYSGEVEKSNMEANNSPPS